MSDADPDQTFHFDADPDLDFASKQRRSTCGSIPHVLHMLENLAIFLLLITVKQVYNVFLFSSVIDV
jgi:hypothetical protein